MNDAYYYFSATLPHCEFESVPPMSDQEFYDDCQRLLGKDDFDAFDQFMSRREESDIADERVRGLALYNRDFRNELIWFRTQRAHKDSGDAIGKPRASYGDIVEAVGRASKEPNLLEAEKILDRTCWQHWDNILMGQNSGLIYIIVYGLKLKILNRYAKVNSSQGNEIFEEIKTMAMPA